VEEVLAAGTPGEGVGVSLAGPDLGRGWSLIGEEGSGFGECNVPVTLMGATIVRLAGLARFAEQKLLNSRLAESICSAFEITDVAQLLA
jgi:hypothetical protein